VPQSLPAARIRCRKSPWRKRDADYLGTSQLRGYMASSGGVTREPGSRIIVGCGSLPLESTGMEVNFVHGSVHRLHAQDHALLRSRVTRRHIRALLPAALAERLFPLCIHPLVDSAWPQRLGKMKTFYKYGPSKMVFWLTAQADLDSAVSTPSVASRPSAGPCLVSTFRPCLVF